MRTTLNIDDDALGEVKELAVLEGKSAGKILSELRGRRSTAAFPGRRSSERRFDHLAVL